MRRVELAAEHADPHQAGSGSRAGWKLKLWAPSRISSPGLAPAARSADSTPSRSSSAASSATPAWSSSSSDDASRSMPRPATRSVPASRRILYSRRAGGAAAVDEEVGQLRLLGRHDRVVQRTAPGRARTAARSGGRCPRRWPTRAPARRRSPRSATRARDCSIRSILDSTKICGRSARPPPCSASSRLMVSRRWITSAGSSHGLDQVDQQAGALEVGEELVAEADALAGALEQPGDIGHGQLAVGAVDGAQHRVDGGERVVGHLRLGVRDAAQQRRLAGVGEAQQRGVGHQLQAQLQPALLAQLANLGGGGSAAVGGRVAAVAAAARRRRQPPGRGRRDGRGRPAACPRRAATPGCRPAPRASSAGRGGRACRSPGRGCRGEP